MHYIDLQAPFPYLAAHMSKDQIGFDFETEKELPTDAESEEEVEEVQVFSVSELNSQIRGLLEGEFPEFWIQGEISNFKAHSSGHWYFSLKDDSAQVSAVMFKGLNSKLKFSPETGLEVMVRGKVTVYEPRGNYQVFCQWMEPVGAGALQKAFEQLKEKLSKEGLFDEDRKRPLPEFPKHIGVVTSPTGAAIRDILNILRRRYRGAQVTVIPAMVQGETAAPSIVKGITLANQIDDLDVLIVGRGGGSMEDMWCFNDEGVARAIAACRVPVISAVGHEVDFTIADFVADLRAPTPSAAAELVVKNAEDLSESIRDDARRMLQSIRSTISSLTERWKSLHRQLVDPRRKLQDLIMRCDELTTRLEQAAVRRFSDHRSIDLLVQRLRSQIQSQYQNTSARYKQLVAKLDALSPLKVVERGYSITTAKEKVIKDVKQIKKGDEINIRFAKGQATAEVTSVTKN